MAGNDAQTKLLLHANGGDGVKSAFAHVKCNEVSGTNVNDSGTGSNTFTASTDTANLTVNGKISKAFDFNGSTEYVTITTLLTDVASDTAGSISFWVNPDNFSSTATYFTFGDTDANTSIKIRAVATTGQLQIFLRSAGTNKWVITVATNLTAGNWVHLVLVQDGVSPKMYVDGSDVTNLTTSTDTTAWCSSISGLDNGYLAVQNDNGAGLSSFLDGKIDDFRYFKCVLSSTEVALLYNSGSGTENSIITNASINGGHTAVQTFNDAQLDTAQKKWGTASLVFDGTGDYVAITDSADWDVAGAVTGSVTIDAQIKEDVNSGGNYLVSQVVDGSNRWIFALWSSQRIRMQVQSSGTWLVQTEDNGSAYPQDNSWHHVSAIRVGAYWGIYVDGNQVGFGFQNSTATFSASLDIGSNLFTSASYFDGHMDEVRVQADNYFSASPNSFPAAPLLLYGEGTDEDTTMSNDGYSGAVTMSNGAKLDNGAKKLNATTAIFFDGTNDYLSVVDSSGTDYDVVGSSTDNWTIDLWVKHTDHSGVEIYLQQYVDATHEWKLYHVDGSGLRFDNDNAGTEVDTGYGDEITDTNWHHVAMVKAASNYGIYLDGSQSAYVSSSAATTYAAGLYVGTRQASGQYFDGYMEQVQITKGNKFGVIPNVGLTSSFSVPTAVLTQDTITAPTEEYSKGASLIKSQAVIIA